MSAEYTSILLPRTSGAFLKPGTDPAENLSPTSFAIANAEPWVQKASRQLWIDNICINPKMSAYAAVWDNTNPNHPIEQGPVGNILKLRTAYDSENKLVESDIILNLTDLYSNLNQSMASFNIRYNDVNTAVYGPLATPNSWNLRIGANMDYIATDNQDHFISTISSEFIKNIFASTGTSLKSYLTSVNKTLENLDTAYIDNTMTYLVVESTFGKLYAYEVPKLATSLSEGTPAQPVNLAHEQRFTVITGLAIDSNNDIEYTTTTFTLPAEGSGGGGSGTNQVLNATSGTAITGTNPVESYTSVVSLSGDTTTVILSGTEPVGGNGTEVRFMTTQDLSSNDVITVIVKSIDGGLIQSL